MLRGWGGRASRIFSSLSVALVGSGCGQAGKIN